MHELPHEIVTVIGRTGSGKTHLIKERLAPRHRRRITIDLTGECAALYPHAYHAIGLRRVFSGLRAWAKMRATAWHMVAVLTSEEVGELVTRLCPVFDGTTVALAELLGGVCLECYEIDVLMPVNGSNRDTSKAMRNAYQRGRHAGLSLLCATQRPSQCDRVVTSQSHAVITFRMHEPRDLAWLRDVGGQRFADEARTLGKWCSAWYHADSGRIIVRDPDYRAVREFNPQEDLAHAM